MIYYRIDLPGGVSTSILIDFVKENQPKSRSISPKIEKWRSAGVPAVLCTLVFLSPIPGHDLTKSENVFGQDAPVPNGPGRNGKILYG